MEFLSSEYVSPLEEWTEFLECCPTQLTQATLDAIHGGKAPIGLFDFGTASILSNVTGLGEKAHIQLDLPIPDKDAEQILAEYDRTGRNDLSEITDLPFIGDVSGGIPEYGKHTRAVFVSDHILEPTAGSLESVFLAAGKAISSVRASGGDSSEVEKWFRREYALDDTVDLEAIIPRTASEGDTALAGYGRKAEPMATALPAITRFVHSRSLGASRETITRERLFDWPRLHAVAVMQAAMSMQDRPTSRQLKFAIQFNNCEKVPKILAPNFEVCNTEFKQEIDEEIHEVAVALGQTITAANESRKKELDERITGHAKYEVDIPKGAIAKLYESMKALEPIKGFKFDATKIFDGPLHIDPRHKKRLKVVTSDAENPANLITRSLHGLMLERPAQWPKMTSVQRWRHLTSEPDDLKAEDPERIEFEGAVTVLTLVLKPTFLQCLNQVCKFQEAHGCNPDSQFAGVLNALSYRPSGETSFSFGSILGSLLSRRASQVKLVSYAGDAASRIVSQQIGAVDPDTMMVDKNLRQAFLEPHKFLQVVVSRAASWWERHYRFASRRAMGQDKARYRDKVIEYQVSAVLYSKLTLIVRSGNRIEHDWFSKGYRIAIYESVRKFLRKRCDRKNMVCGVKLDDALKKVPQPGDKQDLVLYAQNVEAAIDKSLNYALKVHVCKFCSNAEMTRQDILKIMRTTYSKRSLARRVLTDDYITGENTDRLLDSEVAATEPPAESKLTDQVKKLVDILPREQLLLYRDSVEDSEILHYVNEKLGSILEINQSPFALLEDEEQDGAMDEGDVKSEESPKADGNALWELIKNQTITDMCVVEQTPEKVNVMEHITECAPNLLAYQDVIQSILEDFGQEIKYEEVEELDAFLGEMANFVRARNILATQRKAPDEVEDKTHIAH